jgi:beta-lactamase superfamily II metal-dependent hydrolase
MSVTKYEIDILNVKAADAILIRCFNQNDWEYIVLIDTGNRNDGKKIIDHINKYYNQKYIDLAICTHPDNDHIGGFEYVLENIEIKEFWIHDPALHVSLEDVRNKIRQGTLIKSHR